MVHSSIGQTLALAHDRPSGFDFMRMTLSASVILWHTICVCYGFDLDKVFWAGPLRPPIYFILPAFFALSGFLVAGSLLRNDVFSFLTLRALRIFPALTAEVFISAFIIGPIFTSVTLHDYFTNREFIVYLLNMIGDIHFTLPGVFLNNPAPKFVNLQLWTVPYELYCYILLPALALLGLKRWPRASFCLLLALLCVVMITEFFANTFPPINDRPVGKTLIVSFLCGVFLFLLKDRVPYSRALLLVSCALCAWLVYCGPLLHLAAFPIAYITVYIGLTNYKIGWISSVANYSYGIYLYGFAIQQSLYSISPLFRVWYMSFAGTMTVTMLIAAVSWHFLELPVMNQKKPILKFVSRLTAPVIGFFERLTKIGMPLRKEI